MNRIGMRLVAALGLVAVCGQAVAEDAKLDLSPRTVAEKILADGAVYMLREAEAGRNPAPLSIGGLTIYAGVELPVRAGGSIERRSHLQRHGAKYVTGAALTGVGAGVLAWLNNSNAMGGPHYGRGTAEQQQEAASQNRSATVTASADNNGEGRATVNVTINQGGEGK